jgi:hypothetical protein
MLQLILAVFNRLLFNPQALVYVLEVKGFVAHY